MNAGRNAAHDLAQDMARNFNHDLETERLRALLRLWQDEMKARNQDWHAALVQRARLMGYDPNP